MNVEWQNFLPDWIKVVRRSDSFGVLCLVVLIDYHFYHWAEGCRFKKVCIELPLDNVQTERASFHDRNPVYKVSALFLLNLAKFSCDFCNLVFHCFDVFAQKLDVVFTVFECFELQIDKFVNIDHSILVDVHFCKNLIELLLCYFLVSCFGSGIHKVVKFFSLKILILIHIELVKCFFKVFAENKIVLSSKSFFMVLVMSALLLSNQNFVRVKSTWTFSQILIM